MKASFSILIILTLFLGVALVGNAFAQPSDGGPETVEEAATPSSSDAAPGGLEEASEPGTAASDSPPPSKTVDQVTGLYNSVKGGEWVLAIGFLGMLLGSLARLLIGLKWDFITTKTGGYVISAGVGLGTLGYLVIDAGGFEASMLPTTLAATLAAMALHGPAKGLKKKLTGEAA